jgi:hypothetical protein
MKKGNRIVFAAMALLGVTVALAVYFIWPRNHLEVQVHETRKSPDGRWTAVVQMEVYNTAWVVNDAVYAVRLKGPKERDRRGDLVMNAPVDYPEPAPSVEWRDGKLIIVLTDHQKIQYFASSVDGVAAVVQQQ